MRVIVEQIAASISTTENELFELAKARLKKSRAFANFKDFHIYKRSIDARKKDSIKIVYSVSAEVEKTNKVNEMLLSMLQAKDGHIKTVTDLLLEARTEISGLKEEINQLKMKGATAETADSSSVANAG